MDDSIYRLRHRDVLTLCVFGLLAIGTIMVQSAGSRVTGEVVWQWGKTGTRHLIYVTAALVAFFVVSRLDYRKLVRRGETLPLADRAVDAERDGGRSGVLEYESIRPHKSFLRMALRQPVVWLFLTGLFACGLVLTPLGVEINGARRWFKLGMGVQIQASELGKWGTVLLMAWWLTIRPIEPRKILGFFACFIPVGAVCLLIVKEDFGTAALIGFCTLAMMLTAGVRIWHVGMVLPPLMGAAYYFVRHKEYRWKRVTAFIDPWAAPKEEGYHLIQSILAFATGGITGTGLGNGVQKLGYLPEDTTDFIFAAICEELGVFGAMLVVALYLGLLWSVWQIMKQTPNAFGRLLTFGIGTMIGIQAMLNIAVATVSVPPKGLPLPLISFGGTGLVITCAALGLVYAVARTSEKESGEPDISLLATGAVSV